MKAWLLTWEGTSGPAVNDREKIIAILSSRKSPGFVEDLVDVLYCRSVRTAGLMAYEANKKKQRVDQFKKLFSSSERVFYGCNPCIFARVVLNLKIETDEINGIEKVTWVEQARYENRPSSYNIEQVEPEKENQIIRPLTTLSKDIWGENA